MKTPIFPQALLGTGIVPFGDLKISVASPTSQYGHGVFEGVRAYPASRGGMIVPALRQHMARMFRSARALFSDFAIPITQEEACESVRRLVETNDINEPVYIRPSLLIPVACTIHLEPVEGPKELIFSAYAQRSSRFRREGLSCIVSPLRKPHARVAQHKACGMYVYLGMASAMAEEAGYDESILLDQDGLVAEGTYQNIVFEKDGVLWEPRREGRPIMPSITRDVVRCLIAEDMPGGREIVPTDVTPQTMVRADSLMLLGTASEICFARKVCLDGVDYQIGSGEDTPTPFVAAVRDSYVRFVSGELGHEDLLVRV
ncbi:MAG: aminotransferase class IV [Patescibacteria group bacterium]|nr:aminotransferase class IV [Patescibacteria group bacterium]